MEKSRDYINEAKVFSSALAFATEKYTNGKNPLRKDGFTPYIFHPLRLVMYLNKEDLNTQLAALFHDLLEDTDTTEEEILKYSNEEVLEAVKLVTKPKNKSGFSNAEYVKLICENPIAKMVKEADRIDNLKDSCSAGKAFQERYLVNTEEFYVGKFSAELDKVYNEALEFCKNRED